MTYDVENNSWSVELTLKAGASRVDFFSNHHKTIAYRSVRYPTYLSNPYTRVTIN